MSDAVEIAGVRLTSPDKVLYPEQGISKRALADYYRAVAPHMLAHVARRPVTLVRCPAGRQAKCFYQRHAGAGLPPALAEVEVAGHEEVGAYLYLRDLAGLISLVQMGTLEVHPWGARVDRPDRPDRVVFDLDPGDGLGFAEVAAAALEVRDRLAALGLASFVKTTGGKGLHVVVPIARRHGWPQAKTFARRVADEMTAAAPERYLARISKAARRGRVFVDYLRNDPTSTAVAPYSPRARPGAPVATPLAWDELAAGVAPGDFTVASVPARLDRVGGDPWADLPGLRQRLPALG